MKDDLMSVSGLMKSVLRISALERWRASIRRIWCLLVSAWLCGCEEWVKWGVYVSSGTHSKFGLNILELGRIGLMTAVATVGKILKDLLIVEWGRYPPSALHTVYSNSTAHLHQPA